MARKLSGQAAQAAMQNGVRHWAAGKFMAATYDVWLVPSGYIYLNGQRWLANQNYDRTGHYRDVTPSDLPTIGCYVDFPRKDVHPFSSPSPPPDAAYYFRDQWGLTVSWSAGGARAEWPVRGNNLLLARSELRRLGSRRGQELSAAVAAEPAVLAAQPLVGGGGYGWKRPWLHTKGQPFVAFEERSYFLNSCNWFDPN
jgi:hypothetical protein